MPTLRGLYERTRRWMPPVQRVRLAGVPTGSWRRVTDWLVPDAWLDGRRDEPGYEDALVDGLHRYARPGDRVVVAGAGNGVTAVVAAQKAGPDGSVDAYEASDHMLQQARRTLAATADGRRVRLHHAIVGDAHGVYGDTTAPLVTAPQLPACDVLVLDCEGAERDVIPALPTRPRVLLVETHGVYGSPTALVRQLLSDAGFRITEERPAEARYASICAENDIQVLFAFAPDAA